MSPASLKAVRDARPKEMARLPCGVLEVKGDSCLHAVQALSVLFTNGPGGGHLRSHTPVSPGQAWRKAASRAAGCAVGDTRSSPNPAASREALSPPQRDPHAARPAPASGEEVRFASRRPPHSQAFCLAQGKYTNISWTLRCPLQTVTRKGQ